MKNIKQIIIASFGAVFIAVISWFLVTWVYFMVWFNVLGCLLKAHKAMNSGYIYPNKSLCESGMYNIIFIIPLIILVISWIVIYKKLLSRKK